MVATTLRPICLSVVGLVAVAFLAGCAGAGVPPSPAPASPAPASSDLLVYFTDEGRYARAIPPYEVQVGRSASGRLTVEERALATLRAFFAGPSPDERARGLTAVRSGFTGVSELRLVDAVAHVYLEGACASTGATYSVASVIGANLKPFPEILWVKVYDERGETEEPTGPGDSIPLCLEP